MRNKRHNLFSEQLEVKDTEKSHSISPNGTTILKINSEYIQKVLLAAKLLKIDTKETILEPKIAWQISNTKTNGFSILGTLGNFSLVTGKAKSRKTFFINMAISTATSQHLILNRFKGSLPQEQNEVLYIDTEQGKYHVQLALKRICKQINIDEPKNLHVYSLRSKTPSERLEIIEALIYDNDKIGFVVIDGIKDLVTSINDEDQASKISSNLLKWTEERNIHIVTVLHQNKVNTNARGHLGTELINKAETVLSVTKDVNDNTISIVEPQQCRNIEPESFAFRINDNNLPVLVDNFKASAKSKADKFDITKMDDLKIQQILTETFIHDKSFSYSKLTDQMQLSYKTIVKNEIGKNKIKDLLTFCKDKNWLLQEKPKTPYTLGIF